MSSRRPLSPVLRPRATWRLQEQETFGVHDAAAPSAYIKGPRAGCTYTALAPLPPTRWSRDAHCLNCSSIERYCTHVRRQQPRGPPSQLPIGARCMRQASPFTPTHAAQMRRFGSRRSAGRQHLGLFLCHRCAAEVVSNKGARSLLRVAMRRIVKPLKSESNTASSRLALQVKERSVVHFAFNQRGKPWRPRPGSVGRRKTGELSASWRAQPPTRGGCGRCPDDVLHHARCGHPTPGPCTNNTCHCLRLHG